MYKQASKQASKGKERQGGERGKLYHAQKNVNSSSSQTMKLCIDSAFCIVFLGYFDLIYAPCCLSSDFPKHNQEKC